MTPHVPLSSLTRTTARLLTVVFTIMILLFVLTGFLTRSYHQEKQVRAERQFQAARKLADQKRYEEAIEHYAAALRLSRDDLRYKQALALALMEAGRTGEAEGYLLEVARTEPSNGMVNLMLARIASQRGNIEEATEYYQRAVYGIWPDDPLGNRGRVHFELIDWLQAQGEKTLVKAELLKLLDEVPEDVAARKRVGRMLLQAGAPDEAKDIFTDLIGRSNKDCTAYAGLGDANFDLGDYLQARTSYRNAVRCDAKDLQSQMRLEVANDIVNLDPMQRGLGIRGRLARSRALIKRALTALSDCIGDGLATFPQQFRDDVEQARSIASGGLRQPLQEDEVEKNIALAERLHQARGSHCGLPPTPDEALDRVLKELAD